MYQQTTIVGNIGNDPQMRYTQSGVAVCDFSVAVNKVTGSGDNRRESTTWFRVTLWRQLAESLHQYIRKGERILIVGEVSVSAYTNKQGEPAASLELTARDVKLLGSRNGERDDYAAYPSEYDDQPF